MHPWQKPQQLHLKVPETSEGLGKHGGIAIALLTIAMAIAGTPLLMQSNSRLYHRVTITVQAAMHVEKMKCAPGLRGHS